MGRRLLLAHAQIHAFTDVDVVENLDAQGETVRSARVIAGDKPVAVSPITMRRRVNFHATGDPPLDDRRTSPTPSTCASPRSTARPGRQAASSTSPRPARLRHVLRDDGLARCAGTLRRPRSPTKFRSIAGEAFPLYHPLADAIEWEGAEVHTCTSSDALAVVGFAVRSNDRRCLLVVNLTPVEREVVVDPVEGQLTARRLNESTAALAGADPKAFRAYAERLTARGELALTLAPYEVVRLDAV